MGKAILKATTNGNRVVKKVNKAKQASKLGKTHQRSAKALRLTQKIRIGILHGKDFDPVKKGTQDSNYPEKLKYKNNSGPRASGWGGQFHIDVNTGLKIARLHPDIFEIDFICGKEITPARLRKNHMNFAFWHDPMVARRDARDWNDPSHVRNVDTCYKDPNCRLWPNWGLAHWIAYKPSYMRQLVQAGIPTIPTIFLDNGFDPQDILKKVRAKGWQKFFVKVGYAAFFGEGAVNGKTSDFMKDPRPLEEYAKENKMHKCFLVQPYMLKPNGEVFDEIRCMFVNGSWQTGIFTHGTDMTEAGYYEQPPGKLRDAVRDLATKEYAEVKKVAKWHGKTIETVLSRIDVGVIPDKSMKLGYRIFINEIEPETATWLARYWPVDMANVVGPACVNKTRELLNITMAKGHKVPKKAMVQEKLRLLDEQLQN